MESEEWEETSMEEDSAKERCSETCTQHDCSRAL